MLRIVKQPVSAIILFLKINISLIPYPAFLEKRFEANCHLEDNWLLSRNKIHVFRWRVAADDGVDMTIFTPLLNLGAVSSLLPCQIYGLQLAEITDEELGQYFGVSGRSFTHKGLSLTRAKYNSRIYSLSELEQYDLFKSKYALTSSQAIESHDEQVRKFITSVMLLEPSGLSCPVTLNSDTPSTTLRSPFKSELKTVFRLSPEKLDRLRDMDRQKKRIPAEDIDLLHLVSEKGICALSILFLVTILERTLLKGMSNNTEIKFKFSVFGAKLLSKHAGYSEREVFDTLRDAYDIRSSFAHGSIATGKSSSVFAKLYDYTVNTLMLNAGNPNLLTDKNRNSLLLS